MQTSRTVLLPVRPEDVPELYVLCCFGSQSRYWRYRGTTPSPSEFANSLWAGVVSQFKVIDRATGVLLGLVVLYDDGGHHGKIGAVFNDAHLGSGVAIESLHCFIDFVFATRPYVKIFFETSSPWFPPSAARLLSEEATLRDYVFQDGALADLHVYSLYRTGWQDLTRVAEAGAARRTLAVVSLESFLSEVRARVDRELPDIDPRRSPRDLDLDSLDMLSVFLMVDELVPDWLPPVGWDDLMTMPLQDMHHLVSAEVSRRQAGSESAQPPREQAASK